MIKCLQLVWLAVLLQVLWPGTARAQTPDVPPSCTAAFESAQSLREAGSLVEARAALQTCAEQTCPAVIVDKCVGWLAEVDVEIPSVVFVVRDARGNDVLDVRVTRGDEVLATTLSGTALTLNPGSHTLTFHHVDSDPVELTVVVRAGERNKSVEVQLPAATVTAPAPTPAPTPVPTPATLDEDEGSSLHPLVWVGFGLAGAGIIAGAITGGLALSRRSELDEGCGGSGCTQDEIDQGLLFAHVSTASFAVAGAGAALGIIVLIVTADDDSQAQVTPLLGPTFAGVNVRF